MVRLQACIPIMFMTLLAACAADSASDVQAGPVEHLSAKMDHHLVAEYSAYLNSKQSDSSDAETDVRFVLVDASAIADSASLAADFKRLEAIDVSAFGLMVSARVPVKSLYAISQLASLRFCRKSLAATH